MPDMNDWNSGIIAEFRANAGKVGGQFAGAPLLLLHTTGARTGQSRVNPLVYQSIGDDFAVFGSKGGAPGHPDWYRNLVAHPEVTVEVGTDSIPVRARTIEGTDRERIWTKQKDRFPGFAEYERTTSREIPVVVLERRTPSSESAADQAR
jgi:deazaflavin-dependent oxidoreductase (nitroreductase family)